MTWTIVLFASGAILALWFWRWANHPSSIALESPHAALDAFKVLLQRGANGGRARLQSRSNAALRVDFVKYIKSQNDVGFRATLSRAGSLAEAFDIIVRELNQRGIRFQSGKAGDGTEQLEIDFVHDFGLAQLFSHIVFERAMGLSISRDVIATFDLVLNTHNARLTGLDSPNAF